VAVTGHGRLIGLGREDLSGEQLVQGRVVVEAAVGQDGQPVVEVGGLAQRGQDHPAGRDAGQDQVADPLVRARRDSRKSRISSLTLTARP
jgi:hypothetical protein